VAEQDRQKIGRAKLKIEGWLARWLIGFGFRFLRIWSRTIRFEEEDRGRVRAFLRNEQVIAALWHNRLLLFPSVLRKFFPERRGAALISASRDGALLADLVERFGYATVRGSSSRKGVAAVRRLAEILAAGQDVVITPDGPRGPAYELGPGIVLLAQKTGVAVVPVNLEYSSCWRVNSWDGFILPKPFAKVRVILGEPHRVPPTEDEAGFERERLRLQDAMMQLVERK
jgi:lysophospholipid acyltransferase (LPLAT)-like uncharacterized protein